MIINGIYGIKNKELGQWYIGQAKNIMDRWREHLKDLDDPKYPLHIDMAENVTNFEFHILEVVDDVSQLDDREKYWIDYYDSYLNGYNLTRGGRVPTRGFRLTVDPKEVFQYHLDNPQVGTREIGKVFGIEKTTVCRIIHELGGKMKTVNGHNVPVSLTNTMTGEVKEFASFTEAAKYIFERGESLVALDTLRKKLRKHGEYRHYLVAKL